ncbi:MAG: NAD(P)H-binding protein, partial [Thermosynechococcaceae cyanobacterium]
MKLLIFGATGSIGQQLVDHALAQGHIVTAFTRNREKVEQKHENLKVIQGDIMNVLSVAPAVQGQDAVLCSVGAGRKGMIRSEGTRHIIQAMEKASVRRLICQSTLGVDESWG